MTARSGTGVVLCLLAVLARCMHVACGQYTLVYGAMSTVMVGWLSPLVYTYLQAWNEAIYAEFALAGLLITEP